MVEPYFADRCPLIEMEKGDRLGKKEPGNTKKEPLCRKTSVSGAAVLYATASAAQCCNLRGGRVIVTLLSGLDLLLSAI